MSGFVAMARAIASLCLCPPDTLVPPCAIGLWYFSSLFSINSLDWLIEAALSNPSWSKASFPNFILDSIVPEKSNPFCGTYPILSLKSCNLTFLMSTPSIKIFPPVTSKNLGIRFTNVVLPLPVEPINAVVVPWFCCKCYIS